MKTLHFQHLLFQFDSNKRLKLSDKEDQNLPGERMATILMS